MSPFQHQSSKIKKLYTSIFLLSLVAVVVTILLIQTHYKTSEAGSFCNLNDYWNCDRVNKSIFAEIFDIPIAIFGFLFYLFLAATSFGLVKNWNFIKLLSPIKPQWLTFSALIGSTLISLGLLYYEFTILGNWFLIGVVKNLAFIGLFGWVYRYCQKNPHPSTYFLGFLTIMALFGVNFSLYLSDIELFVLEAICVYCFTQEIIIFIIAGLFVFTLKQNQHDLIKSHHSGQSS